MSPEETEAGSAGTSAEADQGIFRSPMRPGRVWPWPGSLGQGFFLVVCLANLGHRSHALENPLWIDLKLSVA